MKLSIVTTLYKSEAYIEEFYRRICSQASGITDDFEIIVVNDGSPDNSLSVSVGLAKTDKRVKVVDLSRNFGHHKAMMAGLHYVTGNYVFMIDTDLEEAPELLGEYWLRMNESDDIDVVYGQLVKRKGSFFKKITGNMFYRLLNFLSGENMPVDISFSRLMTRKYVESLKLFTEREMYIGGLWHIAGFNQASIPVHKKSRGISSYTLRKKIEMLVNAVTAFSSMPLRMIFVLGSFVTVCSLALSLFFFVRKFFYAEVVSGWTSLIVALLFMSGIIVSSIGIVAIYLSKIFIEVKGRPYVIVKDEYINGEKDA